MVLFGVGQLRECRSGRPQNAIHTVIFAVACAFLGNASSSRALAQQTSWTQTADPSSSSTVQFSMHQAVHLALKQNPGLLAARFEALESKQDVRIGLLAHSGSHQVEVLSYAGCFLVMAVAGVIAMCLIPVISPFVPPPKPTAAARPASQPVHPS
jgi:hypothetical protein